MYGIPPVSPRIDGEAAEPIYFLTRVHEAVDSRGAPIAFFVQFRVVLGFRAYGVPLRVEDVKTAARCAGWCCRYDGYLPARTYRRFAFRRSSRSCGAGLS
jgi:hypothetical protein